MTLMLSRARMMEMHVCMDTRLCAADHLALANLIHSLAIISNHTQVQSLSTVIVILYWTHSPSCGQTS
jgi:hypothetical protein